MINREVIVPMEFFGSARGVPGAKCVVVALLGFRHATTGRCDPSLRELAATLGYPEFTQTEQKTVSRWLAAAERLGFITIERKIGCRNGYVIHDEDTR